MSPASIKRWFVILLVIVSTGVAMSYVKLSHSPKVNAQASSEVPAPHMDAKLPAPLPISLASASPRQHPVYGHSVVRGGVHSIEELLEVLRTDPAVAAHYKNFNVATAHIVTLDHPLSAYVSYRMNGEAIYWTRHPISIAANEPLLTDGTTYIRMRCGNVISSTPMTPTDESFEPTDLNTVVAPPPLPLLGSEQPGESSVIPGAPPPTIENTPPPSAPLPPPAEGCSDCVFVPLIPLVPSSPPPPSPPVAEVPEPDSLALLTLGIGTLPILNAWMKRKALKSRHSAPKHLG